MRGEVYSFVATSLAMFCAIIFFPSYYWLFLLLVLVDGAATSLQSPRAVSANRIFFGIIILILGAIAFGFNILGMILETALVIIILDFLFLIRQMWTSKRDFLGIFFSRFRSYGYTLLPAFVFACGLTYIGSSVIVARIGPANAILELGLASVAVFLIIFFATRPPENLK